MRRFAISDMHGCALTFKALLDQLELSEGDQLYLLGDYIDRGPDSKGVIDTIWELQERKIAVFCLKGNHEDMLLKARYDFEQLQLWKVNGGIIAMESFGVSSPNEIGKKYWDFLESLEYYFEVDDYLFVHAGLNFDMPNPLDGKFGMLWIRNWYPDINYQWLGDRIIIHGHTPTQRKTILADWENMEKNQFLNIDNGCFFNRQGDSFGHLCAFDLDTHDLIFQKNIDDMSKYFSN